MEATDYFGLYGYRSMALAVIEQALSDLVQTRDPELRREAMEWIERDSSTGSSKSGLTFADCIEAAGAASARETFRQRCRTEPNALKTDLLRLSTALHCERKMERISAGGEPSPAMAGLRAKGLPPTGVLHCGETSAYVAQFHSP